MTFLLALLSQPAHAVDTDVTICMKFQTNWVDQAGDFWNTNANRLARGVEITLTDDFVSHVRNLDRTGCRTVTLTFNDPADQTFLLRAVSKAKVAGVELESYYGHEDDIPSSVLKVVEWEDLDAGASTTFQMLLPLNQVWSNLAVGTWVFHRNDFDIHTGVTRNCCLEGDLNYQPDGTCDGTPSPGNEYAHIGPPVRFYAHEGNSCCGSSVDDGTGQHVPAVKTNYPTPQKYILAHELGHVIVGLRMGGKESGQYIGTAPLNNCMGDYDDAAGTDPLDVGAGNRGLYTKEFNGLGAREGWANFVAAWAWNSRTGFDCVFDSWKYHDFDLDGDVDDDYVDTGIISRDGRVDCENTPEWLEADPSDPTETYMDDMNWLDDLHNAADPAGCAALAGANEDNRSTVNDWAKFFWYLTSLEFDDHDPSVLAGLYVDMCPRGWAQDDTWTDVAELPLERVQISGDAHGVEVWVDVLNRLAHMDHYP